MLEVKRMETDAEIQASFSVMTQLRPHLNEKEFVNTVREQFEDGYQLTAVVSDNTVVALAGFRLKQNLAWGKFLYVDDLIADQNQRSTGLGKTLINWLKDEARKHNCDQLHLDSGVQRKDAHRFYEREGMTFSSHHYAIQL